MHYLGIGAGIANSTMYFLHATTFSFGIKLVTDGEIEFDKVFR
jgi:hypothetical protein